MATIQVNLVDGGTGAPIAPFFYNLEDGDSYQVVPYSDGNVTEQQLIIQVFNGNGTAKEYLTIQRYAGSIDGSSMPTCLKKGVEKAQNPYKLDGPGENQIWDKATGAAWDKAVSDATSNGGEPGLFQEAIWYLNDTEDEEVAKAEAQYKQRQSELADQIVTALDAAQDAGFSTFRTPGAGILSTDNVDAPKVAAAILGPYVQDLPHLGKVGVIYQSVTVAAGAPE